MGVSPRNIWRRTRRRDTPAMVGNFFHLLALRLFGGEMSPKDDALGDILLWRGLFGEEVKASDDNHTFRIRKDQLDHYSHLSKGFPFEHYLYALFCYRNREGAGSDRKSLLQQCRKEDAVHRFLARSVDTVYLLDIQFLAAVMARQGVVDRRLPADPHMEVLEIGRTLLRKLNSAGAKDILPTYGLNPREWIVCQQTQHVSVTIGLFTYPVELEVVSVLSNGLSRRMEQLAKPRVRRITRRSVPVLPFLAGRSVA